MYGREEQANIAFLNKKKKKKKKKKNNNNNNMRKKNKNKKKKKRRKKNKKKRKKKKRRRRRKKKEKNIQPSYYTALAYLPTDTGLSQWQPFADKYITQYKSFNLLKYVSKYLPKFLA